MLLSVLHCIQPKDKRMILYEGPSALDGEPIVAILTGLKNKSVNTKTGDMMQVWILRSDIEPHKAWKDGSYKSVCGDCIHGGDNANDCYVLLHNAPLSVYRAYKRGIYSKANPGMVIDRAVRWGAFGDPTAIPFHVALPYLEATDKRTGYTHQWIARPWLANPWRPYIMASVDSLKEAAQADRLGWRYFRVTGDYATLQGREQICASDSHGVSCAACRKCDGASNNKPSQVILVHGAKAKRGDYAPADS